MTRKAKKYLFDILQSIGYILNHHLLQVKDADDLMQNITVKKAVERDLGIIGEALYQLKREDVLVNGFDRYVNRRNTLIHQYDAISPQTLWEVAQQDLPELKTEVEKLLASTE
ncbi:MAG: DUF86 domain-containing protein [Bacteroidetes bacterium]|nr:MAG: DUF86 domain-containing protein [Bacteroidota bacterium]